MTESHVDWKQALRMLVTAEIKVITNGWTTGHLAMVQRLILISRKKLAPKEWTWLDLRLNWLSFSLTTILGYVEH